MSLLTKKLIGTGVALVTPFQKNGDIDFDAFRKLIQHVLKGKCEYIVPMGTTGESVTLNHAEKKALLKCAIETAKGRVPVVLGLGGNNTAELIQSLKEFDFTGVDAILSVSPYYNKPSQAGIINHYKALSKASPVPIILYNVPGRTGSNILPQTVFAIAKECKNVIGIKEASGSVDQIMQVIQGKPDGFLVISGDDSITLPLMAAGADGLISVIANAYPAQFSEMVRLCRKQNYVKARTLHYQFAPLLPLLFSEGNPSGIKAVLNELGITSDHQRLPMVPVSKTLLTALKAILKSLK